MAGAITDPEPRRPRRQVSVSRVMFWVACGAVLLAARRAPEQLPTTLVAALTSLVLVGDLLLTSVQLVTGERPAIRWGSSLPRKIEASGGFWAKGESGSIPVDLVTWPDLGDEGASLTPIIDIKIEGRYHLRVRTTDEEEPLRIVGSEPQAVLHRRYGPCLVVPVREA